ncbi:MAG: acyl-CoA dehydrogenase family protein [Acetobacteraceae bacterium]
MTYAAIAREKAAIVERTGLLGEGGAHTGRQVVARFFLEGFGTAEQCAAWLPRLASVAISEPRVGAHPKLLTTRAEVDTDGYTINGEKAWVTNGPLADVFIVLAMTAVEDGRKRYSALLVPRDTPGLSIDEAPQYRALAPSRHCGLRLAGCRVPHTALLGAAGTAYESMALPFRDVEDAVGTFGLLGAFRFLLTRLATHAEGDEAALSLGSLAALAAVHEQAAIAVVAALDEGALPRVAATLVGLRVLAACWLRQARSFAEAHGAAGDAAVTRVFVDLDTSIAVARGPRQVRQARLGQALMAVARR